MLPILEDFVEATIDMQHRETPSGGYRTGGLGEVKYEVDRQPFTGESLLIGNPCYSHNVVKEIGADHNMTVLLFVLQFSSLSHDITPR